MVGSVAALKTAVPRAIQASRRLSKAENPQRAMNRLGDARIISSRLYAESLGEFLKSGINFSNFDALETGLQGIVSILIRGRQDALGVPDQADMISFREPEFSGRSAKGDQG